MLPKPVVQAFNAKHRGECLLFSSERKTHFMRGETWLLLLQDLYGDAFSIQRKKHGLRWEDTGLILSDGWTGYSSKSTGLDTARRAWSETVNCKEPDVQCGGWSAAAQPVDQLHHIYRARLDMIDAAESGFVADLRSRAPFQDLPIKPTGQPAHKRADPKSIAERSLLAWKSMWEAWSTFSSSSFSAALPLIPLNFVSILSTSFLPFLDSPYFLLCSYLYVRILFLSL